jgi:acetyl-CoA C-acetyltransferase
MGTTMTQDIYILSAKRTPIGAFQGVLAPLTTTDLGAAAVQAAVDAAGLTGDQVSEVIMGCVLPAGLGQAPARQATLKAGLPKSTPAMTLNKVCGSGLRAVMLGADAIKAGSSQVVVAGGMESMTNAPYLLDRARSGYRLGHGKVVDHMFYDGLEDAYARGTLMGVFAENTAQKYGFSREQQDEFSLRSLARAQKAAADGVFAAEIASVSVSSGKTSVEITLDEPPQKAKPEKIPQLKPAFRDNGTVTAGSSSSIADGAAAVVLAGSEAVASLGLKPRAVIRGYACYSHEPEWFTTAPVGAIRAVLNQTKWAASDVDFYEINEAFAVVTMAAMHDLELPAEKVNIHGGACALGHPIGASGARILVTLINALEIHGKKRGIAALCIGGGEGVALAVEVLSN